MGGGGSEREREREGEGRCRVIASLLRFTLNGQPLPLSPSLSAALSLSPSLSPCPHPLLCAAVERFYWNTFSAVLSGRHREREREREGERDGKRERAREGESEGKRERESEGKRERESEGERKRVDQSESERKRKRERREERERERGPWRVSFDPAGLPHPSSLSHSHPLDDDDLPLSLSLSHPTKREAPSLSLSLPLQQEIALVVEKPDLIGLGPGINESYHLSLSLSPSPHGLLSSPSPWGIIRALESLSQLISWDDSTNDGEGIHSLLYLPLSLSDSPAYPHRGLSLDLSRHFYPLPLIRRIIDGLSALKLNVLHLHLTDAQSFPILLKSFPELATTSAWAIDQVYTPLSLSHLVSYGYERGVRLIPEFDIPAHADAWTRVFPNTSSVCEIGGDHGAGKDRARAERAPLNPAEPFTVKLVTIVLCEVVGGSFIDPYVHFGADELPLSCWKQDPRIGVRMRERGESLSQIWGSFLAEVRERVRECVSTREGVGEGERGASRELTSVYWDELPSDAAAAAYVKEGSVAQVWRTWGGNGNRASLLTSLGWPVIYSGTNPLYLDTPRDWKDLHSLSLSSLPGKWTPLSLSLLLGAEAALWSEHINRASVLPSLFPSLSALSESLWSADVATDDVAEARLSRNVCFLLKRGVGSAPVQAGPC
jgi:hexosaminidase